MCPAVQRLKSGARDALVGYGEPVLEILGHVVMDQDEDIWVRRHVPATVAQLPYQDAMDLMAGCSTTLTSFCATKRLRPWRHSVVVGRRSRVSVNRSSGSS